MPHARPRRRPEELRAALSRVLGPAPAPPPSLLRMTELSALTEELHRAVRALCPRVVGTVVCGKPNPCPDHGFTPCDGLGCWQPFGHWGACDEAGAAAATP